MAPRDTRSLNNWRGVYGNSQTFARMCLLYAPRHGGERQQREWIAKTLD